jgi:uncharacterized protein YutE (UPF0331/DUF86 family)
MRSARRRCAVVDRNLLLAKLSAIRDRLDRIAEKLPPTLGEFLANRDAQESVSFNLFLAFQDALDLAAHVIADAGWPMPTTARHHFDALLEHGWLTPLTAEAMGRCAGLRNLIAHSYGGLDLGRLYGELPAGRAALAAFSAEMAARV